MAVSFWRPTLFPHFVHGHAGDDVASGWAARGRDTHLGVGGVRSTWQRERGVAAFAAEQANDGAILALLVLV